MVVWRFALRQAQALGSWVRGCHAGFAVDAERLAFPRSSYLSHRRRRQDRNIHELHQSLCPLGVSVTEATRHSGSISSIAASSRCGLQVESARSGAMSCSVPASLLDRACVEGDNAGIRYAGICIRAAFEPHISLLYVCVSFCLVLHPLGRNLRASVVHGGAVARQNKLLSCSPLFVAEILACRRRGSNASWLRPWDTDLQP